MQRSAGRSLDVPVTFKIRGTDSSTSGTLLQLAVGTCRLRTWRIVLPGERLRVDLLRQNGETLQIHGRIRQAQQLTSNTHEYAIEIDAMPSAQADLLAREAAMLVQRRHSAA